MTYIPVVGLEIHVQIKTNSKMFCRCSADYFSKEPNVNVCPVCFGLPGALPVPNKTALEKTIKLALALGCTINQDAKFDRKNYFYPDLAKGYQISQYDQPIGENGYVEIEVEGDNRRIRIQRVHLEEDTGKSAHAEHDQTLIDYNKSGIPLVEIVTYPDFESTEEVLLFAKRLRQIVRYLNVSDAEMQKGQMRFELNISVKPDTMPVGQLPNYKVEVKNIGSISVLEKVLDFEIKRQSELLEKGETIKAQTRGLKGMTGETVFQRSKESADDYRYFPEPDIPPIKISNDQIMNIKKQMPELPHERKQRYLGVGLENEQADIFVEDMSKGDWYDNSLQSLDSNTEVPKEMYKEIAKWIVGDISGQLEKRGMDIDNSPVTPEDLIYLVQLMKDSKISGTIMKNVIEQIFENTSAYQSAEEIISSQNLIQISDSSEIENFIKEAIESNSKVVADVAKNPNAIKFLVGQVMRLSKGKVNPKVAEEELRKALNP
jgi:aspartyl-tRNA(Asn)/glutamyl-tRNA(Gln) amidotransferase subunit B